MMMMMMMLLLLRRQQTERSVDLASYHSGGEGGAWMGVWVGGRADSSGEELQQLVKQFLEPELI